MKATRVLLAAGAAALLGAPAWAADTAPKTDPVNKVTSEWIDVGAILSGRYSYSFQRADDNEVVGRVLDRKDNSFAIDTFGLFLGRDRDGEDFGFQAALDFFDNAHYLGADDGLTNDTDEFEVREVYMTYDVPFGGITVKAGKFVTLLGYEVQKTPTNINHNVSHSLLFGFTKPFTHTGLLFNIPIIDIVSFDVGIVNGWDRGVENNQYKTLLSAVHIDPMDELSINLAGTFGPEQDPQKNTPRPTRGVLTVNGSYQPIPEFEMVVDTVYGNESVIGPNGSAADWYGAAIYLLGHVDRFSFGIRGEVLNDQASAARNNFRLDNPGNPNDRVIVWELSPSVAYQVNDHITARIEYRHDNASDPIYRQPTGSQPDGTGRDRTWNTFAVELLAYF